MGFAKATQRAHFWSPSWPGSRQRGHGLGWRQSRGLPAPAGAPPKPQKANPGREAGPLGPAGRAASGTGTTDNWTLGDTTKGGTASLMSPRAGQRAPQLPAGPVAGAPGDHPSRSSSSGCPPPDPAAAFASALSPASPSSSTCPHPGPQGPCGCRMHPAPSRDVSGSRGDSGDVPLTSAGSAGHQDWRGREVPGTQPHAGGFAEGLGGLRGLHPCFRSAPCGPASAGQLWAGPSTSLGR